MNSILIMIHCEESTGYAIVSLERVFLEAALHAGYEIDNIHFAYKKLDSSLSLSLPEGFQNKIEFDRSSAGKKELQYLAQYVKQNLIKTVLAFDLGLEKKIARTLIQSGVKKIISYWGAPISSVNTGLKLLLKKLDVMRYRYKPDLFIFESDAMALSAVEGRGIPEKRVSVVNLGVDTEIYKPDSSRSCYAYSEFNIDRSRKIVFYSGHMEERKGVAVIIKSALELINEQNSTNIHFILCGNKGDEADRFMEMYKNSRAEDYITFAGYRDDIPSLLCSATVGVIASTGWDSFTMSSVEMMSCGLPLIVSNLDGLSETVQEGVTGFTFPVGNSGKLSSRIEQIINDEELHKKLSTASRQRALNDYDRRKQIVNIAELLR